MTIEKFSLFSFFKILTFFYLIYFVFKCMYAILSLRISDALFFSKMKHKVGKSYPEITLKNMYFHNFNKNSNNFCVTWLYLRPRSSPSNWPMIMSSISPSNTCIFSCPKKYPDDNPDSTMISNYCPFHIRSLISVKTAEKNPYWYMKDVVGSTLLIIQIRDINIIS